MHRIPEEVVGMLPLPDNQSPDSVPDVETEVLWLLLRNRVETCVPDMGLHPVVALVAPVAPTLRPRRITSARDQDRISLLLRPLLRAHLRLLVPRHRPSLLPRQNLSLPPVRRQMCALWLLQDLRGLHVLHRPCGPLAPALIAPPWLRHPRVPAVRPTATHGHVLCPLPVGVPCTAVLSCPISSA